MSIIPVFLGGGEEFSDAHLLNGEQQKDPVSRQKMKTNTQALALACMHPHSRVCILIHTCVIYIYVSHVHSFKKH